MVPGLGLGTSPGALDPVTLGLGPWPLDPPGPGTLGLQPGALLGPMGRWALAHGPLRADGPWALGPGRWAQGPGRWAQRPAKLAAAAGEASRSGRRSRPQPPEPARQRLQVLLPSYGLPPQVPQTGVTMPIQAPVPAGMTLLPQGMASGPTSTFVLGRLSREL